MGEVPDLLTVEEVARVLRIGRTTAYQEVNRFTATGGVEGIPVIVVGGQKRIPRARLEALIGGPVHLPPRTARSVATPPEVVDLRDRRTTRSTSRNERKTTDRASELPIDIG